MASKGPKDLALRVCSGSSSEVQPGESCQARDPTPGFECETPSPTFAKMAKPPKKARSPQPADPGPSPELNVQALWMHVGSGETNYLLLEDTSTGDVLIPLSQVKRVISGNFSRKLASFTARLVIEPEGGLGGSPCLPEQAWYWRKAFESPKNVKTEVKRALGEDASTAGHISIVLLPIVYNAIVTKEKEYNEDSKERQAKCRDFPWRTPFFVEMERLLLESSYSSLIKKRKPSPAAPLPKSSMHTRSNSRAEASAEAGEDRQPLFQGPTSLMATKAKYMFAYKNERARQNNRGPGAKSKRGMVDEPMLPVVLAASVGVVGIDDRLARMQEELQESKRHCAAQDAKIDSLEKKLDRFDGLEKWMAKICEKFGDGSAENPFDGKARQLCNHNRSKSSETISSLGPTAKDNNTEQVCWGDAFPQNSLGMDRRTSAPPEFQNGMGNVSPSPSFHESTPLHQQRSAHLEHFGSSELGNHNPFKPLPCVAHASHFLDSMQMEDSPDTTYTHVEFGGSPQQVGSTRQGTAALPLHHVPAQYGQRHFPIVGNLMQSHLVGPHGTDMYFSLGPDRLNRG